MSDDTAKRLADNATSGSKESAIEGSRARIMKNRLNWLTERYRYSGTGWAELVSQGHSKYEGERVAAIDVESFREYETQGLITGRTHPTHDLIIWNYTPKCQFEHAWNDVTMQARGLITKPDGTIVARPFKKFMNIEQHEGPLPLEPFKVTEKMDGSLGVLYHAEGEPYIATRGSFVSEQAERATKILHNKYRDFIPFIKQTNYYTYLFEIVYPANRIVVDYGDLEDIILLAIINTETGKEHDIHNPSCVNLWPFPIVKHYDGIKDVATLKALEEPNREGFVIRFESGLRLKCKFSDYVRLHRLITQVNARVIWDLLRNNQSFDELLEKVPDEFYSWVSTTRKNLLDQFAEIEQHCQQVLATVKDLPTRKEQAQIIVKDQYSGVVFQMLDNRDYREAIWKWLRPIAERPFREDEA